MMKRDLQLYFTSLFLSLLLCGWLAAFLLVDAGMAEDQGANALPAFSFSRSGPTHYTVGWLGREYDLSLAALNEAEAWRKRHACLVTPRKLLNAEIAASLGRYAYLKYYYAHLENQYLQNIAKRPA